MRSETSGILVVDKPEGMTSAQVVAAIKRTLQLRKIGHAGTLDPIATGVLVCCFNEATRLARFLLNGEKQYRARLHLGIRTDTQDRTGKVLETVALETDGGALNARIEAAFDRMKGIIEQVPPAFSALKHKGTPLYKLARQGRPVHKPPRRVEIKNLHIRQIALPHVDFEVTCSAGTYIRTLCADIGDRVGCGGHLAQLRRTASCGFAIDEAVTLETILEAPERARQRLVPMAAVLRTMTAVQVNASTAQAIGHGCQLADHTLDGSLPADFGGNFQVVDAKGRLLAVMAKDDQQNQLKYLCVFQGAPAHSMMPN